MKHIDITIYSDFACPFCYLGKGLLDALRAQSPDLDIREDWQPYELHPETPAEGLSLDDVFDGEDPAPFFADLNKRGAPLGIHYGEPKLACNSRLALLAGEFAKDHGVFHAFHGAMFRAYFLDGVNIGQRGVVLDVGRSVGLDVSALEQALDAQIHWPRLEAATAAADQAGVTAAPTFFFHNAGNGDAAKFTGIQPLDVFRTALAEAVGTLRKL